MEDVGRYTVYTFWVVAYNVHKGYESQSTDKVTIDTASYGKWDFITSVIK